MNAKVSIEPEQTDAPASSPVRRKKVLRLGLLAFALMGTVGYASHWWLASRFIEGTDDAYVGADVTIISAKVPGYISEVTVLDLSLIHI